MFEPSPLPLLLSQLVLILALAISAITDVRKRLIYNWVTMPALLAELAIFTWSGGTAGLRDSALGALVCAGAILIPAIPGYMGMGDVKLMAVVGAAAAWPVAVLVLVAVTVAGGLQAVGTLVWFRLRGQGRPKYVPYGPSIAVGTFLAWWYVANAR
ncbi:MAG: prepilin peptidase [Deltaproteobacteria bacterium]|nr:prepilin peptidase [Deltaproteobacteria bacterium]